MTDQLTSTGLEIDDLNTRTENLKAAIRAGCGANLDLSPDQPDGQFVHIISETIQASMELLQEVYTTFDLDEATDDPLTQNSALTGTTRRAATNGTVVLTLNLDAAVTVTAGSIVQVDGDPTNRWIIDADVTSVGAGNYAATATAENTGPIQALAGTITVIVTPIAGWNTVTNAAAATEGLNIETDTELRLRREQELQLGGSTSTDAISADISALATTLETVISVKTYENTTLVTDSEGRPPKSIEVVLYGANPPLTDAALAEQIYESKAGGIQAYGTTTTYHVDDAGISHPIGFSRATALVLNVQCSLTTDSDTYGGNATVQTALVDYVDENYDVSDDVIFAKLLGVVMGVTGVVDGSIQIKFAAGVFGTSNLSVGIREIATLVAGGVTFV